MAANEDTQHDQMGMPPGLWWHRRRRLKDCGFRGVQLKILVETATVDLRDAERLADLGCDPATAFRILI